MNEELENRNCPCEKMQNTNCPCKQIENYVESVADKCKDNTREELIKMIKCYQFAIIELALYLDTHPEDEKALCLHRKYCKELKELQDKYQKVYGPLTINFPCNKWRWIEEPWPWERGNF